MSQHFGALRRALLAVSLTSLLAVAGCSGGSNDSSENVNGQPAAASPADGLKLAVESTARAEKGINRPVDPAPRPGAKDKKVAIISSGQAATSSQVPSDAALEAAHALGWQADIYDGKLDPSTYPGLVRQAIAADVDGIVLVSIDCQKAKQPLLEAKAKGIAIIPVYAFDCNDAKGGGEAEGVFSASVSFGPDATDIDTFTKKYGADQANYIIAESKNEAKVIAINDPEFAVLNWTYEGFKEQIEKSGGTKIVSTLEITLNDILTSKLVDKIQAELARHPEATWIKSPFTFATTTGIVPALGAKAGQVKVMGGEGFAGELDLIREGKVHAANVISSVWTGWAAIDAINSVLTKTPVVDSGIGWTILDKDHNLPAGDNAEFVPPVDFKAAYKKAWGIG